MQVLLVALDHLVPRDAARALVRARAAAVGALVDERARRREDGRLREARVEGGAEAGLAAAATRGRSRSTGGRARSSPRRSPRVGCCSSRATTCAGRRRRRAAVLEAWAAAAARWAAAAAAARAARAAAASRARGCAAQRSRPAGAARAHDRVGCGEGFEQMRLTIECASAQSERFVARGAALRVDGLQAVARVAREEDGAVLQHGARLHRHALAHGARALQALAVDDGALRAAARRPRTAWCGRRACCPGARARASICVVVARAASQVLGRCTRNAVRWGPARRP